MSTHKINEKKRRNRKVKKGECFFFLSFRNKEKSNKQMTSYFEINSSHYTYFWLEFEF